MKICFPVRKNEGLESRIFGHFGAAPIFVVADSKTREIQEADNRDEKYVHGACRPLKALGGQVYDAIVVSGIGTKALSSLNRAGLKVYQAQNATISENLESIEKGELCEIKYDQVCAEHSHRHGHSCGS